MSTHQEVEAVAEDYWETFLEASPTMATILGDHRYDDRLEDLSAEGEQGLRRRWAQLLERLHGLDRSALDPADRTTCRQLEQEIDDAVAGIDERLAELQSDQMTSFHVGLLVTASLMSAPDPESAWMQLERLRQVPAPSSRPGSDSSRGWRRAAPRPGCASNAPST